MIKLILFVIAFFSLYPTALEAQESVMLSGQITNDSIDHEYLHILNLTLQKGTITNETGGFTIPARVNDTLYISAIQFKHKEILITAEILAANNLQVELETEVNELEDVNISDIELSGRLGADMNIPKVEKPFDPAAAGLPVYKGPILTAEERKLYTATHSGGGIVPIGAVINALTGRTKMLKEHVRISNMERRVQKARNLISDSAYIEEFNIPARFIDDFVHYVYFEKTGHLQIASSNDRLALLELLMVQAPEYLQFKKISGVNIETPEQQN